ncbi:MAG: EamA family transporter [Mycobacteriales bacterium]
MPVLLALLSSLLWGTSDFLGGTAARRLPAAAVVGLSQALALFLLAPLALVLGARPDSLLPGVVAGAVGLLGLGAFYAALAGGTMGVVAPVASLGVLLPVVVGLVRGESPSALQAAGIVLAVAGVVLASGPELSGGGPVRPLVLAVAAAGAFGLVTVLLADGSKGPAGAVVVTVLVMRVTSVALAGTAYLVVRSRGFRTRAGRGDVGLLAAVGLGDLGANACYALATRGGLLSVVAVLGSLYPVATVLLARQLHAERLRPVQVVGVAGALAGVALLASG